MPHSSPLTWVKRNLPAVFLTLGPCAFLVALLLFTGCSESPTGIEQPVASLEDSSLDNIVGDASSTEWTVTKLIMRRGGSMKLDGEQVVCSFSPGAINLLQVLITAKMELNGPRGSATRLNIDFQPSLNFKKSVTLKVDSGYLAGAGNKYTLWYFDPVRRTWLKEAETTFTSGLPVLFTLKHFSAYAVTR